MTGNPWQETRGNKDRSITKASTGSGGSDHVRKGGVAKPSDQKPGEEPHQINQGHKYPYGQLIKADLLPQN